MILFIQKVALKGNHTKYPLSIFFITWINTIHQILKIYIYWIWQQRTNKRYTNPNMSHYW